MIIGTLRIEVVIVSSRSLKDKRRVIKSLKDRIRNKYNVSISETNAQDNLKYSTLTVAMVGTDRQYVNSTLSSLINYFRFFPQVQLINYELELM
ncbi:MAG: DUF503 domain-containing protein [Candidatus Scalindua sp. AMX11]|nr:MAG: DUF503 domain-containing protein [Candidatus Scalindua sp.]NOG83964.1 DUF503 domain-containing protein [Planctomycetota bacterium]RZV88034.1 MAG: DUF503 domain-containing protein [Candidatus Scalindua sp. SCAELEC01]TDE63798.1 MAG: DUF503 domain-containing protein [Candidatus Scalindua sp. AMX11]GJQ58388.1 MAG: hypothetical protein SCALA701_11890 [Candidatus Scalindua sp.]